MTYVNTMKSGIFFFFGLEKWIHAFFNTFSWDFYEKEIHIVVTKMFEKIELEVTSFRLSYSNDYKIVPSCGMYWNNHYSLLFCGGNIDNHV